MDITTRDYQHANVIRVTGRVDAGTFAVLENKIKEYLDAGHKHLVLEMDGIEYLSSAGVRVLISTQKTLKSRGGRLAIAQPFRPGEGRFTIGRGGRAVPDLRDDRRRAGHRIVMAGGDRIETLANPCRAGAGPLHRRRHDTHLSNRDLCPARGGPAQRLRICPHRQPHPQRAGGLPAALEGAEHGWRLPPAWPPIDTLCKVLSPGDHVLAGDDVYGGTFRLFEQQYAKYGITFSYVKLDRPGRGEGRPAAQHALVWLENADQPAPEAGRSARHRAGGARGQPRAARDRG